MKHLLTVILLAGVISGCHTNSGSDNKIAIKPGEGTHKEHQNSNAELALNNGAKWKADAITVTNVALLQTIVTSAKKETRENYMQTASGLQDGLNKMLRECKMKGPDHEALHHWLEPVMEKTKDLKNASSIETAGRIAGEIEKQISLFSQYFE